MKRKLKKIKRHYYQPHKSTGLLYLYWFCIECQEKNRIWYQPHGSEEDRRQHDYINWYYEQKEKFVNW